MLWRRYMSAAANPRTDVTRAPKFRFPARGATRQSSRQKPRFLAADDGAGLRAASAALIN
jgi:hypothetical protein